MALSPDSKCQKVVTVRVFSRDTEEMFLGLKGNHEFLSPGLEVVKSSCS